MHFGFGRPKDALGSALHDSIIELMDNGGADPTGAAEVVCENRPDLEQNYGRDTIEMRAAAMFAAELPGVARHFQRLFRRFNWDYFQGALPEHLIRVGYAIDSAQIINGRWTPPSLGFIDPDRRTMSIRVANAETMISTLLHEMAHAATDGNHGPAWQKEMPRLHALGAPFDFTEAWIWKSDPNATVDLGSFIITNA